MQHAHPLRVLSALSEVVPRARERAGQIRSVICLTPCHQIFVKLQAAPWIDGLTTESIVHVGLTGLEPIQVTVTATGFRPCAILEVHAHW